MLRYILAIPMADKIERFMTFKGNELWKVVAKICLKSGLWMDGGWMDGRLLGKPFRGLLDPISNMNMHFKC